MSTTRHLIVNADDFGLSPGVNAGIIRAFEDGILTSASLMVRGPAAAAAAEYARSHPRLSVGLHLDLAEWRYIDLEWRCAYSVVPVEDVVAVAAEVDRQLADFQRLMDRAPTHLDSHQHVHRSEPVRSVLLGAARRLRVPVRGETAGIAYCGEFYGQSDKGYPYPEGIAVDALVALFGRLPAGVTELGCHPGLGADLDSVYLDERAAEVRTLCDPRVIAALRAGGIELCSFADAAVDRS